MLNDLVAYYVDHTPGLEPYREENEALVCGAGAQEVAFGEDGSAAREFGPYHLVLESVGGRVLGDALSMLAPGGTCVTFGASAAAETTFDVRCFYFVGGASLYGFILFHEVLDKPASEELALLSRLLEEGRLRPHVSVKASGRRWATWPGNCPTAATPVRPCSGLGVKLA